MVWKLQLALKYQIYQRSHIFLLTAADLKTLTFRPPLTPCLSEHYLGFREQFCSCLTHNLPHRNLFPCGDSMVCIIDDREDVWKFAPNLITVKKYIYFQGTGDINAPPGSRETQTAKKGTETSSDKPHHEQVNPSLCSAEGQTLERTEYNQHAFADAVKGTEEYWVS